jgi:hypothetical protein
MTKEDIIRMALEVRDPEKVDPRQGGFWVLTLQELERFSHLVAAVEREECAKVCDEMEAGVALSALEKYRTRFIADAIRARSKP